MSTSGAGESKGNAGIGVAAVAGAGQANQLHQKRQPKKAKADKTAAATTGGDEASSKAAVDATTKSPNVPKKQKPAKTKAKPVNGSKQGAPSSGPSLPSQDAPKAKDKRRETTKKKPKKGSAAVSGKSRKGDDSSKPKLKVIVRRLPPNLPEEIFKKAAAPWLIWPQQDSEDAISIERPLQTEGSSAVRDPSSSSLKSNIESYYYVPGKLKDRSRRGIAGDAQNFQHTFSRAYLRFTDVSSLLHFHQAFDGHLFRDAKGNEYRAVVEFAPFDLMPIELRRKSKKDSLLGTISSDAHYVSFLASLEAKADDHDDNDGQSRAERTEAQLLAQLGSSAAHDSAHNEQARHTPLLEHLRAQRAAKLEAMRKARSKKGAEGKSGSTLGKNSSQVTKGKDHQDHLGPGNSKGKGSGVSAAAQKVTSQKGNKAQKHQGDSKGGKKNAVTGTAGPTAILERNASASDAIAHDHTDKAASARKDKPSNSADVKTSAPQAPGKSSGPKDAKHRRPPKAHNTAGKAA